jgi:hypothetical protein
MSVPNIKSYVKNSLTFWVRHPSIHCPHAFGKEREIQVHGRRCTVVLQHTQTPSGDAFTDERNRKIRAAVASTKHSRNVKRKQTTMEAYFSRISERGAHREREKRGPLGSGPPSPNRTRLWHTQTHTRALRRIMAADESEESRVQISGSRSTSTKIELLQMDASGTPTWRAWCSLRLRSRRAGRRTVRRDGVRGTHLRSDGGPRGQAAKRTKLLNGRDPLARRSGQRTLIWFFSQVSRRATLLLLCCSLSSSARFSLSLSFFHLRRVSLLSNIPEQVRRCHIYANCRGFKLDARRERDRPTEPQLAHQVFIVREPRVCVLVYYSILRARAAGILGCLSGNAPRFFCASGSSGAAWEMRSLWSWRVFTPGACYLFDINFINICRMQNNRLGGRGQIHNTIVTKELIKYVYFIFIS